ncbi:MAG TPA: PH domain-containing protein [Anaerolineae bacterium]|nr:PH domain-containing protein [Anaerolineae bacterium]
MTQPNPHQTFRPVTIPRRGEAYAWASTLLLLGGMALWTLLANTSPPWPFWLLTAFFSLSALSISLGNWMDRRTLLRLQPDGVFFTNGLRRVFLPWEVIHSVRISPDEFGKRVHILGQGGHFTFRTLSQVKVAGRVQGAFGFTEGDEILSHILSAAGLEQQETSGEERYYGR